MKAPKPLKTNKTVRLIFAGGFLGSGKTTALGALAKRLIRKGLRIGIITNDQSGNLADTLIVRQMLEELDVPVEEVVKGCFCCKFDELVEQMEKILGHNPDILMGEPVGSCTDFVAAVAHPIKIHYKDAFIFSPLTTMVDPDRVRELLLKETESTFPEEVAYLFHKQLEEADLIVLNKTDLIGNSEQARLAEALKKEFPKKEVMPVSAINETGMKEWLDLLLSDRPGAETVLGQIDYDRYATAEAVLGWLNAAVKLTSKQSANPEKILTEFVLSMREVFRDRKAGIGHVKCALTTGGKSMWINLTGLEAQPVVSGKKLDDVNSGTLLVNARVKLEPEDLESVVRETLKRISRRHLIHLEVSDLQCFSPAYPAPPYLTREPE